MTTVMTMLRYNAKNAKRAQRLRARKGALTDAEKAWLEQWEREHPAGIARVKANKVGKASLPTSGAHAAPPPLMSSQGPSPESPPPQPPGQHDGRDERERPSTESTRAAEYSGHHSPSPEAARDTSPAPGHDASRLEERPLEASRGPGGTTPPPLVVPAAAPPPPSSAELEQRAEHRRQKLMQVAGFCAGRLMQWENELRAAGHQGIVDKDVIEKLFAPSLYNLLDEFAPENLGWYGDAFTVAMIGSAEYRLVHALRSGKLTRKRESTPADTAAAQKAASNGVEQPAKAAGNVDADGDEVPPEKTDWS